MESIGNLISDRLKMLRKAKGWSLDVASTHTGVSKAMLGQIERGESSPTIMVLWKIAAGFDVSFSSFIEDVSPSVPHIIQRDTAFKQLHPDDDKMLVLPIFPYEEERRFEMFIIEFLPGCEHLSDPHQKGVTEHIVVAEGTIDILANGDWHTLKKNEGMQLSADQPHGYRNTTSEPAVIHDVLHYRSKPK